MKRSLIELWVRVTSDRRKASVLGALLIIAGGMWLRTMLIADNAPRKARASVNSKIASIDAGEGSGNSIGDREKSKRLRIEIPAPPALDRDLFALSARYFSLSSQTEAPAQEPPKSAQGTVENPHEQELLRQQALVRRINEEAAELRLRSTIVGANPFAVIESGASGKSSGMVVGLGGTIRGFQLVEVRSRSVVLEKSGVQVELGLPLP